jgi:Ca2+-binding EF-hand superfamily protein
MKQKFKFFQFICAVMMTGAMASAAFADGLSPKQIMTHMKIKLEMGFSAEDIVGFRRIARRLDLDGNGKLSLDEYAKNSHFRGNPRGARGFFGAADANKDGQMSANEYAWQRIITDEARKIYSAMDADHDRRVSRKEFIQNGIVRNKSIAEQIFKKLDTNGNGELNLPEYLRNWSRWARSERIFKSLY